MVRAGLLVSACAFSTTGQAQTSYPTLGAAVDELVRVLVNEGQLSGQRVYVGADDFFEEENELRPPLSGQLRTRCLRALTDRQVEVALVQAEAARVLHGRWRRASETHLHLTLFIAEPPRGGEEPVVMRSAHAQVPVESLRRSDIAPTLRHWGERVVRRLERDLPGHEEFRLYLSPFPVQDEALSEQFGAYLLGRWRPAFTGSDRFRITGAAESAEGELHGDVFAFGEHIEVGLRIEDTQGNLVASDNVTMSRTLFPTDLVGPPTDPRGVLAFESGVVTLNHREFPSLLTGRATEVYTPRGRMRERITFDLPFLETPKVMVALAGVDAGKDENLRIWIDLIEVQRDGFQYNFRTWNDTKIYCAEMSWFAFGYR